MIKKLKKYLKESWCDHHYAVVETYSFKSIYYKYADGLFKNPELFKYSQETLDYTLEIIRQAERKKKLISLGGIDYTTLVFESQVCGKCGKYIDGEEEAIADLRKLLDKNERYIINKHQAEQFYMEIKNEN